MRTYKTIHPAGLEHAVTKITVISDDNPSADLNSLPFFADGQPGIYFQESNADIFLNRAEKKLSNLFLYGQTVKPIEINTTGPFKAIILQLHPSVIKALFGIDAHELTDNCIDYDQLKCREAVDLKDRLLDQCNTEDQLLLLTQSIQHLLKKHPPTQTDEMHLAVKSISRSDGSISLASLHKELNVTERTFQRKFLQHVGITPRLFKRICKFQAAYRSLESKSFTKLTDIAYDHAYTDQSHFNRIFKEFTGYTPTQYLIRFTNVDLNSNGASDPEN